VVARKTRPDQPEKQACRGHPLRLSRWEGLTCFIDDGRIELDNNTVERSIRWRNLVMEIGCGTGTITSLLAPEATQEARFVATDIDPEMVTITQQRLSTSFSETRRRL
jgi:SAM-dependent methyltransferase